MSSAIKLTSMVNICLISSNPTLYATKLQYPSVSLLSKPIQFLNLLSSSSSSSSSLSLNKKNEVSSSSIIIAQVAQTSDWAQQEKEEEVTEIESGEESEGDEFSGGFFPEPPEEAKLFVGNLPYDMDSDNLAQLFDGAGVVEIAEVIYNRDTDQSRGFGFVTMSTLEEAEKAVEMFNRYDINGRLLTVNKAAPRGSRLERPSQSFEPALRIYVGNLPWQVDDLRLEQVFSEHGKVVDAWVVYDRDSGRSRGFGFVTMSTQSELDDAIASLDGQSLDGRTIRVNVAEERPRRSSF